MTHGLPLEMQSGKEYVGLVCIACDRSFAIAGPIDAPADQPIKIGSRKPIDVECPFCNHKATYAVDKLRRLHSPSGL